MLSGDEGRSDIDEEYIDAEETLEGENPLKGLPPFSFRTGEILIRKKTVELARKNNLSLYALLVRYGSRDWGSADAEQNNRVLDTKNGEGLVKGIYETESHRVTIETRGENNRTTTTVTITTK